MEVRRGSEGHANTGAAASGEATPAPVADFLKDGPELRVPRFPGDKLQWPIPAPPEEWGRLFADLANEPRRLSGFAGVLPHDGSLAEAEELPNREQRQAWLARWLRLKGGVPVDQPARLLLVIERHRDYLRRRLKHLLDRRGRDLSEALIREAKGAVRATMPQRRLRGRALTAIPVPLEPGQKEPHLRAGEWELFIEGCKAFRVVGSTSPPEVNLLFLAEAFSNRVLFRRCGNPDCMRVYFVENSKHERCSLGCTRALYEAIPRNQHRIRKQTRLRVARHRARLKLRAALEKGDLRALSAG